VKVRRFTNGWRHLLFVTAIFCAAQVYAATFTVTRFDDTAAADSSLIPGTGSGNPSVLRAAILSANATGGAGNTILFDCSSAPCTIVLNGPLPPIMSNLTIDGGTFGRIVFDGNSLYRVFFVDTGIVVLAHLRIQNALAKGGDGGSSMRACGGGGAGLGAGLFVNGVTAAATVIAGFVHSDTSAVVGASAGLTTTATALSPVAGYAITVTAGTLVAANYSFTLVNGTLTVTKAGTGVTLIVSGGTLAATVAVVPPGAGTPTGTVQVLNGNAALGTAPLTGTTASLPGSVGTIVAVYSGDGNFNGSTSNPVTIYPPATSSLSPTSSVNPSSLGQAVTFTAAIGTGGGSPAAGPPTGSVQFSDGAALLGSGTVSGGRATFSTGALTGGHHTIMAQYSGDGTWNASSGAAAVTVSPASTSGSVSLAIASGQIVLASAVAAVAPGAGTPTGSVQFVDTSNHTPVSSASLSGGKSSTTIAAGAASTVMARPISAVYSGDGNLKGCASTPLPAVVNAAANQSASFAADEIASLFGIVGPTDDTPAEQPLTTSLAGVTVNIADSAGSIRLAPLYGAFASAGQINFLVPSGIASGLALVTIALPGGATSTTAIELANTGPGIFTANRNGQGPYAGQVVYVHADGSQTVANSAATSRGGNVFVPLPIDLGTTGDQVSRCSTAPAFAMPVR
jgi:uncharacterized protein (TIGR03437 family)